MKEIRYRLKLNGPVLMTSPGGDPNANVSYDYIPGSAMRGVIAAKLDSETDAAEFYNLILGEDVLYLNAYPLVENSYPFLPIPLNRNLLKAEPDPNAENKKPDKSKSYFDRSQASPADHLLSVEYEVNVHNARNREAGRSQGGRAGGALFRYEAIAADQEFGGRILVKNDVDAQRVYELLNTKKIYLGGSRTADYGDVSIEVSEPVDYSPNYRASTGRTYVFFESDGIFRHPKTGQVGPYALDVFVETLGLDHSQFAVDQVRYEWTGGFNRKWGLPIQQAHVVKKGSTLIIQGDLTDQAEKLKQIEQEGIGERRNEGFGRVIIGPVVPKPTDEPTEEVYDLFWQVADAENSWIAKSAESVANCVLTSTESDLLDRMNKRIAEQEIERYVLARASELADLKSTRFNSLSNSQIGRLRVWMRDQKVQAGEFAEFEAYLTETKNRNVADKQFRKTKVDGKEVRKWLESLLADPTKVWNEINIAGGENPEWALVDADGRKAIQKQLVGDGLFQTTETDAKKYTVRLIESLLTQVAQDKRRQNRS